MLIYLIITTFGINSDVAKTKKRIELRLFLANYEGLFTRTILNSLSTYLIFYFDMKVLEEECYYRHYLITRNH